MLLTSWVIPFGALHSAQSNCDPKLKQITDSALGYRERGGRCEGLYIENVGLTPLLIASLTESFEKYDASNAKPLYVEWNPPPGSAQIQLRAQGLNPRLYYRMDTTQPAGSNSYTWPSDVLASLGLQKNDIGVAGRYPVGQTERYVYVPLRLSQTQRGVRNRGYMLALLPGMELQEVFITLALTGPDGKPKTYLKNREKLGYGFYPADRRIDVPISGLTTPGTYYLHLGTTLRASGTATIELWFYHSGT